ncbi:hypothetical protein [Actinacidiphila guanduensis]|nr:hypothetical protein [Actinacidiphila guanduensis]
MKDVKEGSVERVGGGRRPGAPHRIYFKLEVMGDVTPIHFKRQVNWGA